MTVDDSRYDKEANIGAAIIAGGIWRVVALAVATLVGVAGTAIISRQIGPSGFALFATALSLVSISVTLSDFGLLALGLREFTEPDNLVRDRSFRALITLRLAFSGVSAVAIVCFALLSGYPEELVVGLGAAGIGLVAMSLQSSYLVPLQGSYRLNTVAVLEALRQLVLTGLMVIAAVATKQVGATIAMFLPAGIVMALVVGAIARRLAPVVPSFDWQTTLRLIRLVSVYALAATIGGLYAFVAQVASDQVLAPHESGVFGLAFRTFAVLVAGGVAAIMGAFPLLVQAAKGGETERLNYAGRRVLQTSWIAGLGCMVALVTGAPIIVHVLGGASFDDAIPVLAVIGVAVPFSFALFAASSLLLAHAAHRELVVVCTLGALVSVAATVLLADRLGAIGAAEGIVVGEFIIAAGYIWVLARTESRIVPRATWVSMTSALALASCAPVLLPTPSAIKLLIGITLFCVLILGLRLLPPELTDRLRALRP